MGVLQRAYTFIKKHWSTDDDVFPDDLNRYEDGIDDLYGVTNKIDKNIGGLSGLLTTAKTSIVAAINEVVDAISKNTKQINVLDTGLNDRGIWVLPKGINAGSCNSLVATGLYLVSSYTVDDCPTAKGTDCAYIVDVKKGTPTSLSQIATSYYGANSKERMFLRTCLNGVWSKWEQVSNKAQLLRNVNIDDFYTEGTSRLFNTVGSLPEGIVSGSNDVFVTCYPLEETTDFIRKTLLDNRTNKMYLYSKADGWKEVATTTKTDIPFPFNTGYKQANDLGYTCKIVKNSLNEGTIYIAVAKTDGTDFAINTSHPIGNLPLGFRSKFNTVNSSSAGDLLVYYPNNNASLIIYNDVLFCSCSVACKAIYGQIKYEVV